MCNYEDRVVSALDLIMDGVCDGDHHKAELLDELVQILSGSEEDYLQFKRDYCSGVDGPDTYAYFLED